MSDPLIQYAFVAGELSPTLHGRSDLEKYDLGLSLVYNFFVDYRGGISSRPGTEFVDYVQNRALNSRMFKFQFSPDTSNTYVILVGDGWMRFIQSGAYVLETATVITAISKGAIAVVTSAAHGYSTGDLLVISGVAGMTEVNGRTFVVGVTTANTYQLINPSGTPLNSTSFSVYTSGGEAERVYTVASPWDHEDVFQLVASQRRDEMVFTHPNYTPYKLTRAAPTNWTLSALDFTDRPAAPTGLTLTPSTAGTAGIVFAVTAVKDGVESPPIRTMTELSVNYSDTAGSMKLTWARQDADYFLIYRSLILPTGADITLAQELGFLGKALGPQFVDNNIIPDFTRSPPEFSNPFATSGIDSINVTAVGSGYAKSDTVSVSGPPGSGFAGYPIVNDADEIIAVVVTNPGSGYVAPVVSFGTSGGSGATATATLGETGNTNPAANRMFQQRRVFAGSNAEPMTIWGSRINDFDNFDVSSTGSADDAYEFTLDAELVAPIRHILPAQSGLVVMSEGGVFLLRGAEGKAVDPTNALADPQSYNGVSFVPPATIDTDILYTQEKGSIVRALSFNDFSKVYAGIDVSTLSNHLFRGRGKIVSWTYAEEPFKLIWAARQNGGFLSFTYVKEQEVFAWAQHWTEGNVRDVLCVDEDDKDVVYLLVERNLSGEWVKTIERLADRDFGHIDEYWGVDCALRTTMTKPNRRLQLSDVTGVVTITAPAGGAFSAGDVGKILRYGEAKAEILTYVSAGQVTANVLRDFPTLPNSTKPQELLALTWSLAPVVSSVSGLFHLEGEDVAVLADGSVSYATVENGTVVLTNPASIVVVGLPFVAKAKTLPLTAGGAIIEGKRKSVVGVSVRVNETRGLALGHDADSTYEMKDRTTELYGEPTRPFSGAKYITIEPEFEPDGSIYLEQPYPLPATILGLVCDVVIGDEDA